MRPAFCDPGQQLSERVRRSRARRFALRQNPGIGVPSEQHDRVAGAQHHRFHRAKAAGRVHDARGPIGGLDVPAGFVGKDEQVGHLFRTVTASAPGAIRLARHHGCAAIASRDVCQLSATRWAGAGAPPQICAPVATRPVTSAVERQWKRDARHRIRGCGTAAIFRSAWQGASGRRRRPLEAVARVRIGSYGEFRDSRRRWAGPSDGPSECHRLTATTPGRGSNGSPPRGAAPPHGDLPRRRMRRHFRGKEPSRHDARRGWSADIRFFCRAAARSARRHHRAGRPPAT